MRGPDAAGREALPQLGRQVVEAPRLHAASLQQPGRAQDRRELEHRLGQLGARRPVGRERAGDERRDVGRALGRLRDDAPGLLPAVRVAAGDRDRRDRGHHRERAVAPLGQLEAVGVGEHRLGVGQVEVLEPGEELDRRRRRRRRP